MLPGTRRYCRYGDMSRYWTQPPILPRPRKSQNRLEMHNLQSQRHLGSPTDFVPLSTHLQTRAQELFRPSETTRRIWRMSRLTPWLVRHEVDYMPLYTLPRLASLTSLHPNTIPTCQIGQLSAGPRSPLQKVASQRTAAATHQIQLRPSMKTRRSYRQPRGAQPAIRKEALLTTPMDLPWPTQTIRKTQQ
jgi:hypothetical protein